jgi:drug/metabolite transporter (DMT)-like permease
MEKSLWLGILFAVLASTNINVGKGIQKWKVKVLGKGKAMFNKENRRDLRIWLIGMALTASATVLYSYALKFTDKASIVSSLNGVGMIGLVLFAWLVIRERIGAQEVVGAAMVLIGTAVMGYFDKPLEGGQHYQLKNFLVIVACLAAVLLPPALYSWKTNKLHGLIFGAIPGIFIGVALILADMALVKSGNSILGQLRNPYPYIAMFLGLGALTTTQLAFWRARAMVVVPTINSFIILTPVVIEYFTFGTVLQPAQYLAIAVIIGGVVMLTYTEKQDRMEAEDEEDSSRKKG